MSDDQHRAEYSSSVPIPDVTSSSSAVGAAAASSPVGSQPRRTPRWCSSRRGPTTARDRRVAGRPTSSTAAPRHLPRLGLRERRAAGTGADHFPAGARDRRVLRLTTAASSRSDARRTTTAGRRRPATTRWAADAIRPALARALERLAVRTYADDEVGPFHRFCLDAAAALGLPRADDLDDLDGGARLRHRAREHRRRSAG